MNLYDFQEAGLKRLEKFNRCAFYWDMGTGKTVVGSHKAESFNNPITLIVCQKSKIKDWVDHYFENHRSRNCIFDITSPSCYDLFFKTYQNRSLFDRNLIAVINYDLLIYRPELKKLRDFTLVLDESQAIQNDSAKRTKYISKMNPKSVVLLSGTPVDGRYENLYSQLKLLGWNISKKEFWDRYINFRLWQPAPSIPPIKIVTGYKNVDDLKHQLHILGADFLKTEEVLTLPDQVFHTINVQPTGHYKTFIKKKVVQMNDKTFVGDTHLTQLLFSRQLCGIYNKDKLNAFGDWVNSCNGRLIVFYNFTEELNQLKLFVKNRPISIVNGEFRDLEAYEKESDSVTFIQYQAGATGLNLQKSNHIAFFTLPLSSGLFEQAKKRIHRIGQEKTCFYYYFLCNHSVEINILNALKQKKDYTDKLFSKDFYE